MDEHISITDPSIEVMRHAAILNVYRQLADASLSTADDCHDAALALNQLEMLCADYWIEETE